MEKEIDAFFEKMQQTFEDQDVAAMLELFTEPLPVYSESGITLLSSHADTETSIRRLLMVTRASGVTKLRRRIIEINTNQTIGTMAHLEWFYLGSEGELISSTEVKYYCGSDSQGTIRILMLEYLRAAFPEALSKMPEDAPRRRILN